MLRFSCKDPLLARHYDDKFREQFEAQWRVMSQAPPSDQEALRHSWKLQMFAEARRQEHYDYIVTDEGVREVIHDTARQPKLLIPEVEIMRGGEKT